MEFNNEYCEKHCKGYRDTGGRCFSDGRCDAYLEYQKQKNYDENTSFRLRAQLSILKDVEREYPGRNIGNIIAQIEARIKEIEKQC